MNKRRQTEKEQVVRRSLGKKLTAVYLLHLLIFLGLSVLWIVFANQTLWPRLIKESGGYFAFNDEAVTIGLFAVPVLAWIGYTIYFIRRPLRYLDELIQAAEQMAMEKERPIRLSAKLRPAEKRMNEFRVEALQNERHLQEENQKRNDLILYLAHDLKTPLTSVLGYLSLIQENPNLREEQKQKYTKIAYEKAERLQELVEEFFDITKFSLTDMRLSPEQRNMSRMLEQMVSEYTPLLEQNHMTWKTRIQEEIEAWFDAEKMQRVFDNLIRNAISYSDPDTALELTANRTEDQIQIQMKNHGPTIPPDKISHLFEQFYRVDDARNTRSGGAGLGLAIAKVIIELHHGTVTACSREGVTCFEILLPSDCRQEKVRNGSE